MDVLRADALLYCLFILFTQGIALAAMILSTVSQVKPAEISFSAAVYTELNLTNPLTTNLRRLPVQVKFVLYL